MKTYWYLHYDNIGRTCDGYVHANNKQEACDKLNASDLEVKKDYKPRDLKVAKQQHYGNK